MMIRILKVAVLLVATVSYAQPGAKKNTGGAGAIPTSKTHMPKLYVVLSGTPRELTLEKTQLATTKTKPSSMKSLAADSVVTQAMQAGINTATWDAANRMNS